jgi:transcriptional regulator with XRE-family HTH domain
MSAEPAAAAITGRDRFTRAPTLADAAVGRRIRELRRAAGRTQKELADVIGVTNAQLHRYEAGATRVAASRLLMIADALGVRVERLMGDAVAAPAGDAAATLREDTEELVQALAAITDPKHRAALLSFARALAGSSLATGAEGGAPR